MSSFSIEATVTAGSETNDETMAAACLVSNTQLELPGGLGEDRDAGDDHLFGPLLVVVLAMQLALLSELNHDGIAHGSIASCSALRRGTRRSIASCWVLHRGTRRGMFADARHVGIAAASSSLLIKAPSLSKENLSGIKVADY